MKIIKSLIVFLLLSTAAFGQTTPWANSPAPTPQTRTLSGSPQIRWIWWTGGIYSVDDSIKALRSGNYFIKNQTSQQTSANLNISGVGIFGGSVTAGSFIGNLTGNASTVTTNANLTGQVTSVGNVTSMGKNIALNGI